MTGLLPVKLLAVVLCLAGLVETAVLVRKFKHPATYAVFPSSILVHTIIYYVCSICVFDWHIMVMADDWIIFTVWVNALVLHMAMNTVLGIGVMIYILRRRASAKY